MIPHETEFTARVPPRNKRMRLLFLRATVSPAGRRQIECRQVGNGCCRHLRTIVESDDIIVHRKQTPETPFDLPKPRGRRR